MPNRSPSPDRDTTVEAAHARVTRALKQLRCSEKNTQGEVQGGIADVALDRKQGCAASVIRSFAGFLDRGAKLFALAWRALRRSPTDASQFELDVADAGLQAAPVSGSKDRPDLADRRWGQQIHEYYGLDPYWNPAADKGSAASAGR